jgi:hypothetical protein
MIFHYQKHTVLNYSRVRSRSEKILKCPKEYHYSIQIYLVHGTLLAPEEYMAYGRTRYAACNQNLLHPALETTAFPYVIGPLNSG